MLSPYSWCSHCTRVALTLLVIPIPVIHDSPVHSTRVALTLLVIPIPVIHDSPMHSIRDSLTLLVIVSLYSGHQAEAVCLKLVLLK